MRSCSRGTMSRCRGSRRTRCSRATCSMRRGPRTGRRISRSPPPATKPPPRRPSPHRLEDLALEHAGYKALTEEDVCGRGAKAVSFGRIPVQAALDYAGERADLVLQLAAPLRDLLAREQLDVLYDTLEHPLIPV